MNQQPPVTQIIVGFLLPIVGVILTIILWARGHGAHGAAVLLTSMLGFVVWSLVLSA